MEFQEVKGKVTHVTVDRKRIEYHFKHARKYWSKTDRFLLADVQCVYMFHKEKKEGVWFHLNDDTIFNKFGEKEHDMWAGDFLGWPDHEDNG